VSMAALLQLQQLMWRHEEPAVRQLAFMLLQKLAGQPATLFRLVVSRLFACFCYVLNSNAMDNAASTSRCHD
jgi:hypothetical protein